MNDLGGTALKPYDMVCRDYQVLREAAYESTLNDILPILNLPEKLVQNIRLLPVNQQTAQLPSQWLGRKVHIDWAGRTSVFLSHPRRFECSIWVGSELCAISLGKVSKGASKVRIDLLEKNPESPLNGVTARIVFECALRYAVLIGKDSVVIKDPIEGKVTEHYLDLYPGFMTHHKNGVFDFRFNHISFDIPRFLEAASHK